MSIHNIDELLKRAILESERKQDGPALESQQKVWDRIEKPKNDNKIPWLLVSSLAAAISLFLISTILYLKLDEAGKELMAIKEESFRVDIENKNIEPEEIYPKKKGQSDPLDLPTASFKLERKTSDLEDPTLTQFAGQEADKQGEFKDKASIRPLLAPVDRPQWTDPVLDIQPLIPEQKELYAMSEEKKEKTGKPGKLKISFGAGTSDTFSQQNLAINLKLKN
jgi:hypothetical protein